MGLDNKKGVKWNGKFILFVRRLWIVRQFVKISLSLVVLFSGIKKLNSKRKLKDILSDISGHPREFIVSPDSPGSAKIPNPVKFKKPKLQGRKPFFKTKEFSNSLNQVGTPNKETLKDLSNKSLLNKSYITNLVEEEAKTPLQEFEEIPWYENYENKIEEEYGNFGESFGESGYEVEKQIQEEKKGQEEEEEKEEPYIRLDSHLEWLKKRKKDLIKQNRESDRKLEKLKQKKLVEKIIKQSGIPRKNQKKITEIKITEISEKTKKEKGYKENFRINFLNHKSNIQYTGKISLTKKEIGGFRESSRKYFVLDLIEKEVDNILSGSMDIVLIKDKQNIEIEKVRNDTKFLALHKFLFTTLINNEGTLEETLQLLKKVLLKKKRRTLFKEILKENVVINNGLKFLAQFELGRNKIKLKKIRKRNKNKKLLKRRRNELKEWKSTLIEKQKFLDKCLEKFEDIPLERKEGRLKFYQSSFKRLNDSFEKFKNSKKLYQKDKRKFEKKYKKHKKPFGVSF